MSDYYTALKAWQNGRNAPGEGMPEAFRIRPALKKSPEQIAALERVREWTRAQFKLPEDAAVMVAEVACGLPGCPPLRNGGGVLDRRRQAPSVQESSSGWSRWSRTTCRRPSLKNALMVDEEASFACC